MLKNLIAGNDSEKKLFDAMREMRIGGILIGGFKVSNVRATGPRYKMIEDQTIDSSFDRRLQNDEKAFEKVNKCKLT